MKGIYTEDNYKTPAKICHAELKVKGSRFICTLQPVESKEEAEEQYVRIKKQYYDATHNCLAYRINTKQFRYSDDGEPSGTAGRPIYQELCGQDMLEILCVVTRYFGGTKLGTGGLARAYAQVTREALERVPVKIKTHYRQIIIAYAYNYENQIRRLLNEFQGRMLESDYGCEVQMTINIPASKLISFKEKLIELSNSHIEIKDI